MSSSAGAFSSGSPVAPGKTSKVFSVVQNELGFVRGVETDSNQVGFVKPKVQSLPTDFSWDKLMPASWSRAELRWPEAGDWWSCRWSRVLMLGAVAGVSLALLSAALDPVSYDNYSNEGNALMRSEPMKAVAYFRNEADRESIQTWTGAPRHLAALEGLAEAYDRAGFRDSAGETYGEAVKAAEKAPIRDRAHLIRLLSNYSQLLERNHRQFEAGNVRARLNKLRDENPVALMILFIILGLGNYSLYAAHCLLENKRVLETWRFYFWFSLMPFGAFIYCGFISGMPVLACLVFASVINYVLLPGLVHCIVEIGGSTAPYWYNALTSRRKSRK
jgi:tetratricopeptide (TPR) repeat protein